MPVLNVFRRPPPASSELDLSQPDELLRRMGWRPGRQVDTTAALAAYAAESFEVWPAAHEPLAEFDELSHCWRRQGSGRSDKLSIDGRRAAEVGPGPKWASTYARAVGHSAPIPLGFVHQEDGTIWLAREGDYF